MSQQLTIDQRKERIQTIAKVLGLAGVCLILGPVYMVLLHGMAALAALGVASAIGFVAINLLPSFSVTVANWRLKAIKASASTNPIETLENLYKEKMEALERSKENINQSFAVLQQLFNQIKEHDEKYPGKPSQYLDKYKKLNELVQMRGRKYKQAKKQLEDFSELIEEKRSDWKIAQTMAAANKLANVGQDFQSKLLNDTAVSTIQDGLNEAFAQLDTSLLEEGDNAPEVQVSAASPVKVLPTAKTASGLFSPKLDLDGEPEVVEAEVVSSKRK